jgi:hypothetical protein
MEWNCAILLRIQELWMRYFFNNRRPRFHSEEVDRVDYFKTPDQTEVQSIPF